MRRSVFILSSLLVVLSCSKEDRRAVDKAMEFSVNIPEVAVTKAEVTESGLTGRTDKVYVYGMMSDGASSKPVFESPGVAGLYYDNTAKIWNPKQGNDVVKWEDDENNNYYYRFYGYAYSSNARVGTDLIIANDIYGRQFTVTQPETASWTAPDAAGAASDESGTIDYLLSYLVSIPPSANYPLVPLHFEHAMSKVEVDVRLAQAMIDKVQDIRVSISGIKRGATMLCLQPKQDGEEGTNTWHVTFTENLSTASYTVESVNITELNKSGNENGIAPDMSFIAIPVMNEEMDGYTLTLTYYIESQPQPYVYSFDLKKFTPDGWVNGHKVRYVLTIDNSIHLTGKIVDFEDVDYIEAVVMPGTN